MWTKLFDSHMKKLVQRGTMHLTYADGVTRTYGDGSGKPILVTFHDPTIPRKFIFSPDLAAGEAYMDGRMTIVDDDLRGLLELALRNRSTRGSFELTRIMAGARVLLSRIHQINPAKRSKDNVAHHYDLSEKLYDLFLDDDRQYSCAYF